MLEKSLFKYLHVAENVIKKNFPSNHFELKQVYKILQYVYMELHLGKLNVIGDNYDNHFLHISQQYKSYFNTFPNINSLFSISLNLDNLMIETLPVCDVYCTTHCMNKQNCIKLEKIDLTTIIESINK